MKKLVILLLLIFISCKEAPSDQPEVVYESKYPYGTIMYLKPDSLKVVITTFDETDGTYKVYWRNEEGDYKDVWVSEEWFFGEVEVLTNSINLSNE